MSEASARLGLPFLVPGQAQKELYHNEALATIDVALHAAVESGAVGDPPEDAGEGQCWIVAAPATGAWAGREGSLASWTSSGWRFVQPLLGMLVWNKASNLLDPVAWQWMEWWRAAGSRDTIGGVQIVGERQPPVPSHSGGTTIHMRPATRSVR